MSYFPYQNGELYAEGVAVSDIVSRYGTPTYVYSRAALEAHDHQAWLSIEPVRPRTKGTRHSYDVVGPVCETGDFLGKDRQLILQAGDLLAVGSAGPMNLR